MEAEELKKKMVGKEKHRSCLCCPSTVDVLPLDTKIYNGFGGWTITKDGDEFFTSAKDIDEWEETEELNFIEDQAQKDPKHVWRAILFLPLRGATYERSDCGQWILIESNEGFA